MAESDSIQTAASSWRDSIRADLRSLSSRSLRRRLRVISGVQAPVVRVEGFEAVHLAGNNYLGLADHPLVAACAAEAAHRWGSGAGASPLISGYMEPHEKLSKALARFKKKDASILFGSGFLANTGLISSLAGEGDAVFSDALNHASIVDGCRLSRAKVHVFAHGDLNALEDGLRRARGARQRLIAVDGVFSMDGDLAPLDEMASLADRHDALLLVDEAHATGILGPSGRGAAAHFGVQDRVGVSMGTLGKSLASYGAFACSDTDVINYLVNHARSFIYSTALPPALVASAGAALELASGEEGEKRRKCLAALCRRFRAGLERIGFEMPALVSGAEVPIFPIVVGDARSALALADHMLTAGFLMLAIRPPTVPEGTSRLRATLMATHTEGQIDRALDALEDGLKKLGVGPSQGGRSVGSG
ncbi:MAG TPA: 8-amino-7-oxononanoate synthase [Nitrospinae bacterium]|nr:8-amino-7-oxononanoate synthase [Nitrospinota bacterium]